MKKYIAIISVVVLICAIFYSANQAHAAAAIVQVAGYRWSNGTSTTLSLPFTNNTTAGNMVVVVANYWKAGTGALSVAVGSEATPSRLQKNDPVGSASAGAYIFFVPNIVGGSKTVTITSSETAGNTYITAKAFEVSGVTSNPFDASTTVSSTGTTITVGALTPSQSSDIFFAAMQETNSVKLTSTDSFTLGFNAASGGTEGQGGLGEYFISSDSSAQTASATFTSDADNRHSGVLIGFKTTSGAPAAQTLPKVVINSPTFINAPAYIQ